MRFRRLRELRLSPAERGAARAERLAEKRMRGERDNEWSADRRAAALEAEARRFSNSWPDSGSGSRGGGF